MEPIRVVVNPGNRPTAHLMSQADYESMMDHHPDGSATYCDLDVNRDRRDVRSMWYPFGVVNDTTEIFDIRHRSREVAKVSIKHGVLPTGPEDEVYFLNVCKECIQERAALQAVHDLSEQVSGILSTWILKGAGHVV